MATFALIPGAACSPWYWEPLANELHSRRHRAIPVDLPCEDDAAGLAEYADTVVEAIRTSETAAADPADLVLVAHSLGGFTAPLVCTRLPVKLMVMVTAMIAKPGEAPDDWWANTGFEGPPYADLMDVFFHDVPPELAAEAMATVRGQSGTPTQKPWPLPMWPDIPTRFILCRNDRFFPPTFMRRVVADRLGVIPDEIDTGHMPMLARPVELADLLESYLSTTKPHPA